MNIAAPTSNRISQVRFSFYNPEELKKMSVLNVTQPMLFDSLGHPVKDGLYDPALGSLDRSICSTCKLSTHCPGIFVLIIIAGHFGHINLALQVLSPTTFKLCFRLLNSLCKYCHSFRTKAEVTKVYCAKIKLVRLGLVAEAMDLDRFLSAEDFGILSALMICIGELEIDEKISLFLKSVDMKKKGSKRTIITSSLLDIEKQFLRETPKICANCKGQGNGFRKEGMKIFSKALSKQNKIKMLSIGLKPKALFVDETEKDIDFYQNNEVESFDAFMTPNHVAEHLRLLYENEFEILDLLYGASNERKCDISLFTLKVIPVTPSKFRPASKLGDKTFEHPQVHITSNGRINILSK